MAGMSTFLNISVPTQLLADARRGEATAQEGLYRLLARPTYTLLRRLVVRPAIADELMQEVFIEVLRRLERCHGADCFAGWVRSIAVSKALMYLRSPWHQRLLAGTALEDLSQHAAPHPDDGWSDDLERALNALPNLSRSIVWLHDVEGYTHEEIAQLHGRTASFSKSQLARAHEALRAYLEQHTGAPACTSVFRN
jgi:RNA polymerase sigma-70 factor (ECF subfamily)